MSIELPASDSAASAADEMAPAFAMAWREARPSGGRTISSATLAVARVPGGNTTSPPFTARPMKPSGAKAIPLRLAAWAALELSRPAAASCRPCSGTRTRRRLR